MQVIQVKIDVTKINKSRLFKGKQGTYLDAVIFVSEQPDRYGNDGMIVQSVSKEEREQGIKGEIIGNIKISKPKQDPQQQKREATKNFYQPSTPPSIGNDDQDLPF